MCGIVRRFYCTCARMIARYNVAMVRHGESEWNKKNLFCGWYDAKLSDRGREEARSCGKALLESCFKFDLAFTSLLTRAQKTLDIILGVMGQSVPVEKSWRLNERHYGELTGLSETEAAAKFGKKQVDVWWRGYDSPPPPIEPGHPWYYAIVEDPRYKSGPPLKAFPKFESVKAAVERTLPYWNDVIVPEIKCGKSVLIVAHGNSLKSIIKKLDKVPDEDITKLNLPTGIPFIYSLDDELLPLPNGSLQFLGDPETVKRANESIKAQGKG